MTGLTGVKHYGLKAMAAARLLSEVTVLVLLVLSPLVLVALGKFLDLPVCLRVLLVVLSLVSLGVLPAYGFVVYRVSLSPQGIAAVCLLRKQMAGWSEAVTLVLRTDRGWRRYVLSSARGEIAFPLWLEHLHELVEEIRLRLPDRGRAHRAGPRIYRQDWAGTAVQFLKLCAALALVALFWVFYGTLSGEGAGVAHRAGAGDVALVLGVCLVLTAGVVIRGAMTVLAPRRVSVGDEGLVLETLFFKKDLAFADLKAVRDRSFFFLGDGLLLRTRTFWWFLGEYLDGLDELEEDLRARLRVPQT